MKKFISIVILTVLLHIQLKAQVGYAALTGKTADGITSVLVTSFKHYGMEINTDTIKVKPDHTFTHRVKTETDGLTYLSYGKNKHITLLLRPGDNLALNLQGADFSVSGSAAAFANYYRDDKVFWGKIYEGYQRRNPGFDDNTNRFTERYFAIQDSISLQRIDFLKNYFQSTNADSGQFVQMQKLDLVYSNLYYKLAFEGSEAERFKFFQERYYLKRTDGYLFSEQPVFNDLSLLNVSSYRRFFNHLLMTVTQKRIKNSKLQWSINSYIDTAMKVSDELAGHSATSIKLKAIFLNDLIDEVKTFRHYSYADKINTTLTKLNRSADADIQLLVKKLDKIVLDTKFNKGNKAPDFVFTDQSGKQYTLNSFKGKRIYIDMGASWCGPCIAGIPAWNKFVAANSSNNNAVFISLSIDDTSTEWKEFLKKHEVKGMNLYAGVGGFKSKFAMDYSISYVPHLMVIDQNGAMLEYNTQIPTTALEITDIGKN